MVRQWSPGGGKGGRPEGYSGVEVGKSIFIQGGPRGRPSQPAVGKRFPRLTLELHFDLIRNLARPGGGVVRVVRHFVELRLQHRADDFLHLADGEPAGGGGGASGARMAACGRRPAQLVGCRGPGRASSTWERGAPTSSRTGAPSNAATSASRPPPWRLRWAGCRVGLTPPSPRAPRKRPTLRKRDGDGGVGTDAYFKLHLH